LVRHGALTAQQGDPAGCSCRAFYLKFRSMMRAPREAYPPPIITDAYACDQSAIIVSE
jgi:hypothetical protein